MDRFSVSAHAPYSDRDPARAQARLRGSDLRLGDALCRDSRTKWHKDKHYDIGFDFGPDIHDTFDAFYAMRAARDDVGDRREIPIYASRKIYGFHLDYERVETIDSEALGAVEAIRVIPRDTVDGERAGNGAGKVWITRDARRLPLRIRGWLNGEGFVLGGVAAELVEYVPGTEPFAATEASVADLFPTRDGRPAWDPPPHLTALRRDRGLVAWEKRRSYPNGNAPPRNRPLHRRRRGRRELRRTRAAR